MKRYQNLLVCLNLHSQDQDLIRYTRLLAEKSQSKKVFFMHISGNLEMPESVYNEYPSLIESPDEFAEKGMSDMVKKQFGELEGCELIFRVVEGAPLDSLIRLSRSESVDMILIGRRRDTSRNRRLSEKLTRQAPCPVLVFPEKNPVQISRIMIATDFSDHSAKALDAALAFSESAGIKDLYCYHAYKVPENYEVTGKSFSDFSAILLRQATDAYTDYIQGINLRNVNLIPVFEQAEDFSEAILRFSNREKIDLVVVGARGAGAGIVQTLGSLTEALLQTLQLPILSIKQKGESDQILDMLFK